MTRPKAEAALAKASAERRKAHAARCATAVLVELRRGYSMHARAISEACKISRESALSATRLLVAEGLVISETTITVAQQNKPPREVKEYTAIAGAEWPEWLPMPQEAASEPVHGAIADAWRRGVPNAVWQWRPPANDAGRDAA